MIMIPISIRSKAKIRDIARTARQEYVEATILLPIIVPVEGRESAHT
jgi:predicted translin family RNA/ssDNA-binding protein